MENEKARAYREWVENNHELFTDASLFLRLNHKRECRPHRPWNTVPVQFQEDTETRSASYRKGEIKIFQDLQEELSTSYRSLLKSGANLPAAELDGNELYQVYNGILVPSLSILQLDANEKTIEGVEKYIVNPPRMPGDVGPIMGIRIGLDTAYAHCLLKNISPEKKVSIFDYLFKDEYVVPSMRIMSLLKSDQLSSEELHSMGRNIQKIDKKVLEAMALQRGESDNEMAQAYFEEFTNIASEDRNAHIRLQAHEMKNACRPTISNLRDICRKLGIEYANTEESAERFGGKTLDDLTLFD